MHYRADIDGLRAIAVLSVVLYHLGYTFIPGGFVGVDVFFVISGFLITKIIDGELRAGNYSVQRFYVRRARRIFPALFAMLAATAVVGVFVLFPPEMADLQMGMLAGTTFVSNIYFFLSADYFAGWVDRHPLLHLWSLAVEEQFYILFPWLLMVLARGGRRWMLPALLTLTVVSFAVSLWLTQADPRANFYLLPSRIWELTLGALLALYGHRLRPGAATAQAMAVIGLLLIAFAVLRYNSRTPFPGLAALAPCVGAAAVILSGQHHAEQRVLRWLGSAPLRFVGLVSFSFYLWHWPVIVFYKSLNGGALDGMERVALLALSFALAVLSWRFVERPFRNRSIVATDRGVFAASAAAAFASLLLAAALVPLSAALWPQADRYAKVFEVLKYGSSGTVRTGQCFLTQRYDSIDYFDRETCLSPSSSKPNLLLIGDSHAAQYYAGLSQVLSQFHVLQATASGCVPVLGASGEARCTALMKMIFEQWLPANRPDVMVIAGRWKPENLSKLVATIEMLNGLGIRPVVLGPIVEYEDALPRVLARAMANGDDSVLRRSRVQRVDETDAAMQAMAAARGETLRFVSVRQAMCAEGACITNDEQGRPLQFDYGHLTAAGSVLIIKRISPQFDLP